ncbi:hypothetical protein [Methylobacterium sp. SI9]|uniref:hypothetical protein n=1 Tax=Methylobacterium guangdongense TaxID=3138811 RepID=UPI00313B1B16
MPNEPLGGRAEGCISKGIEERTELAKRKRQDAVRRLADYGQVLVDGNDAAAEEAMTALRQDAREASEAERWVHQNQGAMGEAKLKSPKIGSWRDIIVAGEAGELTPE